MLEKIRLQLDETKIKDLRFSCFWRLLVLPQCGRFVFEKEEIHTWFTKSSLDRLVSSHTQSKFNYRLRRTFPPANIHSGDGWGPVRARFAKMYTNQRCVMVAKLWFYRISVVDGRGTIAEWNVYTMRIVFYWYSAAAGPGSGTMPDLESCLMY